MGEEIQEVQLQIIDDKEKNTAASPEPGAILKNRFSYSWCLKSVIYSTCLLTGQTGSMLLGRLYFEKGGNSKWIESLVQSVGFPILIPFYSYFSLSKPDNKSLSSSGVNLHDPPAPLHVRVPLYLSFGIALSMANMLATVALKYLPVSTFSIVSAMALAFNAFFAFFINSQKFTILIMNSLVLLIISTVLLVIDVDSSQRNANEASKGKHAIGFVCALFASAMYGLTANIIQLCFRKVLKGRPLKVIFELQMCNSAVASCIYTAGLFASGDWRNTQREKHGFMLGDVSYVMDLVCIAIMWQLSTIGSTGLIFEVSSVFCNVISVVGLPIVPIAAVFIFHEEMDGVKVLAMILALWGFISYIYQHYLDYRSLRMQAQAKVANNGDSCPETDNN